MAMEYLIRMIAVRSLPDQKPMDDVLLLMSIKGMILHSLRLELVVNVILIVRRVQVRFLERQAVQAVRVHIVQSILQKLEAVT